MNPYIFNFTNGVVFCILGLWSMTVDFSYAYHFMTLGAILIILTYFVRNSDKFFGSIAMFSTILSSLALGYLFFSTFGTGEPAQTQIGMMMISGIITSAAFLQCAITHSSINDPELVTSGCCGTPSEEGQNTQKAGCC